MLPRIVFRFPFKHSPTRVWVESNSAHWLDVYQGLSLMQQLQHELTALIGQARLALGCPP